MANIDAGKMMDTLGNVTKLAANLSEAQKTPRMVSSSTDDSNNAATGNQTVQISVEGSGKRKDLKPIEKHIHTFPEARALTDQECDLAWKKAMLDADIQKAQMAYDQRVCDRQWQHKLEQEKKAERKRKIGGIIAAVCGALGVGCFGYAVYCDYRDSKNAAAAGTTASAGEPVKVEATVK